MAAPITFADVALAARRLSRQGPLVARTIQRWRPYFCPFHVLLNWVPPAARVLDVGCGSGLFLALAAELTTLERGLGLDVREPAIALARQMLRNVRPAARERLEFRRRDDAEAWPTETFDVVSLINVLRHLLPKEQEALLDQAVSKLAPGGILIYQDIGPRPRWRAALPRLHHLLMARQWKIHLRPFSTTAAWAERAQLKQVDYQRVDPWWYGHDLVVFRRPIIDRPHWNMPASAPQRRMGRRS